MKTKMITIPFDVDRAKRIQAGEEPGKIATTDGRHTRVVCWDFKPREALPIISLATEEDNRESFGIYSNDGYLLGIKGESKDNLCLQIPEWSQFKDGDVIYCDTTDGRGDRYIWLAVMKELHSQTLDRVNIDFYFSVDIEGKCKGETGFDGLDHIADSIRLATEEEKKQLIDALKKSSDLYAKEYLKRFFGIEEKQECEFEFLQPVLVRDRKDDCWGYGEFAFERAGIYHVNGGTDWASCIPYNEKTKHLLGTTDNWEEEQ